ncbi:pyruvate kinase family protein [Artemisia annua]|uniref:Pyruvate kinase family protein n=1 Tax=Artemisia annua TaxID=35608 RepID=A0A2U1LAW2_ARTAN|nr:pyruvate kinase family protein [Artemisia annua]
MLREYADFSTQAVKTGDTIFIGQYLFTGSETTSVWLEADIRSRTTLFELIRFQVVVFHLTIYPPRSGQLKQTCNND